MKIQAYLTAAAINLKRLAAALFALLWFRIVRRSRLAIQGGHRNGALVPRGLTAVEAA